MGQRLNAADGFPFGDVYRGDIYALQEDEEELRRLGVEIGPFNDDFACFEDCRLSPLAMHCLVALGDKYLTDLRPVLPVRYN